LYRNYDGKGGAFGDVSTSASSADATKLHVYAAQRTGDNAVTVVVVNKTAADITSALSLSNHAAKASAHVFVFSSAQPKSVVAQPDLTITDAGNIVTIDLGSHTITTATQGTWSGSGGHVVIDPAKITLANLHTGTAGSKVIADVAFTKATKDLTAMVDAQQVALESITPKAKGMVSAHLDVARRGGRCAHG